jgi:glycosyltransferase involved in cell wall biosynthesis
VGALGVVARGYGAPGVRILFVTQMWPGPDDPDFGAFLVPIVRELEWLGHEVEVVAIDRRGGSRAKYPQLTREARAAARRSRPDVVFAHMLFPAGAAGALAARAGGAGLVVMAHGQDVANIGRVPGVRAATRWVVGRAGGVIANSRWLADQLVDRVPAAQEKLEIANCGIDLHAFSPRPAAAARAELGWEGDGPAFLCVGSLIERKNVVALADAFAELGRGRLAFVGDGPLRGELEGRPGVRITGRLPQAEVPRWIAACDVLCQPSLTEPFGQALLEGMAMERSVVGTTVGGPPEFVAAEAGVLAEPGDAVALTAALERAADLPSPNPAARAAAEKQDVRVQVSRMAAVLEQAAR